MKKGILLISLGHRNYTHMAITLAASIKANEPDTSICLATDRLLPVEFNHLFDSYVQPEVRMYTVGNKLEFIKAKLHMYELSPFDETLFLDVDQIVLEDRKLSDLFDQLQDVQLTFSNEGAADHSLWADVAEVKAVYGDKPFWNYHSELVYFKKCKEVKAYFKRAQKIYAENKLQSLLRFAGGTMADELAFQIAAMQTGIYPHREWWLPNFWHLRHKDIRQRYPYQLKKDFYTYSIGGAHLPSHVATNYNHLAAFYFQKLGMQNPYQAKNKSSFLPERQKF